MFVKLIYSYTSQKIDTLQIISENVQLSVPDITSITSIDVELVRIRRLYTNAQLTHASPNRIRMASFKRDYAIVKYTYIQIKKRH